MKTFLLDQEAWDLVLDLSGNIAVASDPYSQAQDAASAIKLFRGEAIYDTAKGVPYWTKILGLAPPLTLVKSEFEDAALTVPGVATAASYITSFTQRHLQGQVQIVNEEGLTSVAGF